MIPITFVRPSVHLLAHPFRLLAHPFRWIACALGLVFVGCASTSTIHESELAIVPTESPSSFSRSSQSQITTLNVTPDMLADPTSLERNETLSGIAAPSRAVLLSEAWYLKGQNDIDVPIAVSLDRFLRAAHHAYDGIFADTQCDVPRTQLCADLFTAYNQASREVARLTHNGLQLPEPSQDGYVVDREADHEPLEITEWEVALDEKVPLSTAPTLGATGTACMTLVSQSAPQTSPARVCAPIAFLVLFEARPTDPRSRAHIAVYKASLTPTLPLHGREVSLAREHRPTWERILAPTSTGPGATTCLAEVDSHLPTIFFTLSPSPQTSEWALIASHLSSDPQLYKQFNFCVLTLTDLPSDGSLSEFLTTPLATLTDKQTGHTTAVLIAQGASGEQFVRALKLSLKERRTATQSPVVVAGSLVIPDPKPAAGVDSSALYSSPSELSKSGHSTLRDTKRLLSKLTDGDEGALGTYTRGAVANQPGMTVSPVM